MKFARIHIENWRNFTRVDVPLQQRMFLFFSGGCPTQRPETTCDIAEETIA
jgi:hypothetical protein